VAEGAPAVPARARAVAPSPPDQPAIPDQTARERIRTDLATTLFVEAGAGSGKTTALVQRVLALVITGLAEIARIAAITFTEKAAAELRDRVRSELESFAARHPGTTEAMRCQLGLEQLDSAAVGTLHSFAKRVLGEHPIEAGLPPRVDVLDEVSSSVAFEHRWSMFQDDLLADPEMERTLLLLFGAGVRPEALRYLAQDFEDNWDLAEEQVPASAPEPPSVRELFTTVLPLVSGLCSEPCRDPADKLRLRIDEIADRVAELQAIDDEVELIEALGPGAVPALPKFKVGRLGRSASWRDVDDVRRRVAQTGECLEATRQVVLSSCARKVGSAIRRFTLGAARERQTSGELQFHDLLVLARALLRDPRHGPAVRARLHQRYQRLLLDEFQDTDPIQVELAVRIAAADPASEATTRLPWDEVEVAPGRLFVVGDPKQSIYRFRRADISVFLAAEARFGRAGGKIELTANFRSGAPVIDWVNGTFGALMSETDDVAVPLPSQPAYTALDPTRPGPGVGPAVSVLGRLEHPKEIKADELRTAEAGEVAATVTRVVHEGWRVGDGRGGWYRAGLGDITILVPARTSLPFLEDALEDAGIPFRAEATSLVYSTRAVRDLLMVLRAVDDPTNYLYIVSALRTPLLACGDDDLFRFHAEHGGRWSYLADQPETVPVDDPVRQGLAYLSSLYNKRSWLAPSELLTRIALDRRALELGFGEGRPRDVWRRLRFVIDQARAWSEATGGNLRQYLGWVALQTAEGARVAEAILPETDDDAVRVMTIHAAKGLEFPVTIVSGMSTIPQARYAPAQVVFPPTGEVGYRFSGHVTTEEYDAWKPIDEQMGLHERIRLLYVACTRARDHLVLSLHRKARAQPPEPATRTNAELLVEGMGALLSELPDAAELTEPVPVVVEPPSSPPPFDRWLAERTAALEHASRPRAVAATALTEEGALDPEVEPDAGLQKRPRDLDLPPWLKGRYGSAVGRAVHGVLQMVDLATGGGLEGAVAAQSEAEAVVERADDVGRLAGIALASAPVREAATSPHWREVYVCAPVGGRLLEGYVDLLYRTPAGLVVVDYKTAATSDPEELDRRVEVYRNQGASYALSVSAATGEPVVRVTFLFLTPDGAVERDMADLDLAVGHVRQLVAEGEEVLVP
jgi:ATP-dependent helicase/nuclease subunit A